MAFPHPRSIAARAIWTAADAQNPSVPPVTHYRTVTVIGTLTSVNSEPDRLGPDDKIFPPAGATPYLRNLPKAELPIIDTGRLALEDKADEVALFRAFLERHAEKLTSTAGRTFIGSALLSSPSGSP